MVIYWEVWLIKLATYILVRRFGHEIVGGMLDIEARTYRYYNSTYLNMYLSIYLNIKNYFLYNVNA